MLKESLFDLRTQNTIFGYSKGIVSPRLLTEASLLGTHNIGFSCFDTFHTYRHFQKPQQHRTFANIVTKEEISKNGLSL